MNFPHLERRVLVTSYQSLTGSGKEVAFSLLAAQALLNFKATGSNRLPSSRPDRFAHRILYFQILRLTLLADIFRPRRECVRRLRNLTIVSIFKLPLLVCHILLDIRLGFSLNPKLWPFGWNSWKGRIRPLNYITKKEPPLMPVRCFFSIKISHVTRFEQFDRKTSRYLSFPYHWL